MTHNNENHTITEHLKKKEQKDNNDKDWEGGEGRKLGWMHFKQRIGNQLQPTFQVSLSMINMFVCT